LPTGTISSDLAVLFVGSQNGVTTPSGWTLQGGSAASYWAGYVFTKTLSSGDITTGSVTVTLNATSEAVGMMATIVGSSTSGVREVDVTGPVAGSSSSATMTTSSSVISTDTAVYFGSSRASAAPTVSRGTSQQTGTDGSAAAGVLTYEQLSSGGAYTTTVNYSGYNPMGYFQAVVILKH
jgi:hypothetical protein